MKLSWNKKKNARAKRSFAAISKYPNLPFDEQDNPPGEDREGASVSGNRERPVSKAVALDEDGLSSSPDHKQLARSFQSQGDKLSEEGKYREALGKWETALTLIPENAVLHEQKAQVLLEIGDAWGALKAAIRATELDPSWAEAWITLGRAQLNFGEPDSAIASFDRALSLKPDCEEAQDDRRTALHLVKKRKQLHLSGVSTTKNRFVVGDKE
ncbi:uncharacterized protein LOC115661372 isoform X2 [Syzygium oleosum]|uniref:uncharacterized protein LOC115661372 isoform X2 n=1 Tax=Syzygium oleosum TaxID=219896 RepID=UPI0024B9F2FA|nr:uncharacterized protein LOC115661372 isoform X2 [Syzygium oleosum]